MKTVLVTGGMGFIGSHTVVQLIENNYEVVIVDDLSNSSIDVLQKLETITGKKIIFHEFDLKDYEKTHDLFTKYHFDSVIHFAGYKAVGESVSLPVQYYDNNILTTINILKCMDEFSVPSLVFSSSATVYGNPESCPIDESFPTSATNPYGRTKLFIEYILQDYAVANKDTAISILRYFNPVGAHESGLIGENPNGIPNNLVPYISQVASKKRDVLPVFGNDYNTPDGTGVRDYIHVVDLANGHLKALEYIDDKTGCFVHNLGTGTGYSVLDMITTFEEVSGQKVNYKIVERRPGDIAECYANPNKAKEELGWSAKYDLRRMLQDTWKFEKTNK